MKSDQLDRLEKLISAKETLARMGGTPVFVRAQGHIDEAMKNLLDELDKEKGVDTRPAIQKEVEPPLKESKAGSFIATEFGNGEHELKNEHPQRRV